MEKAFVTAGKPVFNAESHKNQSFVSMNIFQHYGLRQAVLKKNTTKHGRKLQ